MQSQKFHKLEDFVLIFCTGLHLLLKYLKLNIVQKSNNQILHNCLFISLVCINTYQKNTGKKPNFQSSNLTGNWNSGPRKKYQTQDKICHIIKR
jgi:hypothetical protein